MRKPRSEDDLRAEEEWELQYRFKLAVERALAAVMDAGGSTKRVWDVVRAGQYVEGEWSR